MEMLGEFYPLIVGERLVAELVQLFSAIVIFAGDQEPRN